MLLASFLSGDLVDRAAQQANLVGPLCLCQSNLTLEYKRHFLCFKLSLERHVPTSLAPFAHDATGSGSGRRDLSAIFEDV